MRCKKCDQLLLYVMALNANRLNSCRPSIKNSYPMRLNLYLRMNKIISHKNVIQRMQDFILIVRIPLSVKTLSVTVHLDFCAYQAAGKDGQLPVIYY